MATDVGTFLMHMYTYLHLGTTYSQSEGINKNYWP